MTAPAYSATAIAADIAAGGRSAADVIEHALERLSTITRWNAVTRIYADRARQRAAMIDAARAAGRALGPLAGVPFAAKDLYDVAGHITRAGSASTDADPPADRDADAIAAMEAAGAILVASTTMDELAYGFTGDNGRDGAALNPRGLALDGAERATGGSSSGSAALVGAGIVPIALGSDTNGSIRVPAALCGVTGLKPTYGRLSRGGVFGFVTSLDHVGPLATTVADAALAYDALQGPSDRDPVQARRQSQPVAENLAHAPIPRAKRLAGHFADPLDPDMADALEAACSALGADDSAELTLAAAARGAAFIITNAEGGALHLPALIDRPEAFGALVRDRLRAGALLPAVWVARAHKLRRLMAEELARLMAATDILLAPATPCPAFTIGTEHQTVAGRELALRLDIGLFTQPLTMAGVPIAVVSTTGARSGLPVGIQIIGRPFREDQVLAAALALERQGFHIAPQMPPDRHDRA